MEHTEKDNLTEEQLKKARETGDYYAKSKGKKSITDITEPIKEGLESDNPVVKDLARMEARKTVEELSVLILKQELFTTPDEGYMSVVNVFDDGTVKEGNGKLYDFKDSFGSDTYQANEFVPNAYSKTSVDEYKIQMYAANGQLSEQGYQFRKSLVYNQAKWIPYFKMGNLTGFIAMLQSEINQSWKRYIFHKIMNKIITAEYQANFTSNADNAFDAWNDFLKIIRLMETDDIQFNKSSTTALMSSNPKDLLIFAHPDNVQTLQGGIKSQVYNAKFLDFKGILNESNFINCGKKLQNTDNINNIITVNKENTEEAFYIPKNTIYVIHKNAIKHINQLSEIATTFYPRNLAVEWEYHKWGALDFLPWGQCFKFTCNGLSVTP